MTPWRQHGQRGHGACGSLDVGHVAWGSGELMGWKLEAAVLFPQSHFHWLQAQGVIHPVTAVRSWPGWEQQARCWGPERQPLEITDAVSPSRRERSLCTSQPHLQAGGAQGTAVAGLGLAWGTLKFISLLRHCLGQTWLQSPPPSPGLPPLHELPLRPQGCRIPPAQATGCSGWLQRGLFPRAVHRPCPQSHVQLPGAALPPAGCTGVLPVQGAMGLTWPVQIQEPAPKLRW